MHLDLIADELGLEEVFYGERQHKVEGKEKDTLANIIIHRKYYGGRHHHQANAEYGKKCQYCHDAAPEYGGVEFQNGEHGAAENALDDAADAVAFENGVGYFLEFGKQQPVFIIRQGREFDEKFDKPGLVNEKKKDYQDHNAKKNEKLENVGRPVAGLVVEE